MKQQCDYITGSLQLLPEGKEACQNRVYCVENTGESEKVNTSDLRRKKVIEDLTRRLLSYAVWDKKKTDVNWPVWRFVSTKSMAWSVRTMNMYLYEGLSGMLLLFSCLCQYYQKKEITDIFLALKSRLFRYTDTGLKSPETLQSSNTGLYEGEASILYTYLHLYEACGDEIYLSYARKHAQIVSSLLEKDTRYDLLSGNAGAAIAMIRLYEITEEEQYARMAAQAVRTLEKAATEMPVGIGWHISGEETAMAGMAHGNSGIRPYSGYGRKQETQSTRLWLKKYGHMRTVSMTKIRTTGETSGKKGQMQLPGATAHLECCTPDYTAAPAAQTAVNGKNG